MDSCEKKPRVCADGKRARRRRRTKGTVRYILCAVGVRVREAVKGCVCVARGGRVPAMGQGRPWRVHTSCKAVKGVFLRTHQIYDGERLFILPDNLPDIYPSHTICRAEKGGTLAQPS